MKKKIQNLKFNCALNSDASDVTSRSVRRRWVLHVDRHVFIVLLVVKRPVAKIAFVCCCINNLFEHQLKGFQRTVCNNCCLQHFTLMIDQQPRSLDGSVVGDNNNNNNNNNNNKKADKKADNEAEERYRLVEIGTTCVDCVLAESSMCV
jgi:hypothetical protein